MPIEDEFALDTAPPRWVRPAIWLSIPVAALIFGVAIVVLVNGSGSGLLRGARGSAISEAARDVLPWRDTSAQRPLHRAGPSGSTEAEQLVVTTSFEAMLTRLRAEIAVEKARLAAVRETTGELELPVIMRNDVHKAPSATDNGSATVQASHLTTSIWPSEILASPAETELADMQFTAAVRDADPPSSRLAPERSTSTVAEESLASEMTRASGAEAAVRKVAPVAAAASPVAPLRIFIHHSDNAGREEARSLAGALRQNGFEVKAIRVVRATPATREIRYFHAPDSASAVELARHLGQGAWRVRDFRSYPEPPRSGTVEIWLPDRARSGAAPEG